MKKTIEVLTNPAKLTCDTGRYSQMSNVQLLPGSNGSDFIVATNGKACCWIPVPRETTQELPGRLPIADKIIPRRKTNRLISTFIDSTGVVTWHDKSNPDKTATVSTEGKFPKTKDIIPTWEATKLLTIDAKLLLELALAVNDASGDKSTVVTLDISNVDQDNLSSIPVVGDTGIGVIMPFAVSAGHCQLANKEFSRVKTELIED